MCVSLTPTAFIYNRKKPSSYPNIITLKKEVRSSWHFWFSWVDASAVTQSNSYTRGRGKYKIYREGKTTGVGCPTEWLRPPYNELSNYDSDLQLWSFVLCLCPFLTWRSRNAILYCDYRRVQSLLKKLNCISRIGSCLTHLLFLARSLW